MSKLIARPLLIVLSAPSGTGKTTLGRMLLKEFNNMRRSVSGTTRPKRNGEINGRDYIFLTAGQFREKSGKGYFLEMARVHGHCYGTPAGPVLRSLRHGLDVLLVIDVQGARQIRAAVERNKRLKAGFVDIFLLPPGIKELKRRLAGRGQDRPAEMRLRLKNAAREMRAGRAFRYTVVNDRLKKAYEALRAIVIAEHCRNPGR